MFSKGEIRTVVGGSFLVVVLIVSIMPSVMTFRTNAVKVNSRVVVKRALVRAMMSVCRKVTLTPYDRFDSTTCIEQHGPFTHGFFINRCDVLCSGPTCLDSVTHVRTGHFRTSDPAS